MAGNIILHKRTWNAYASPGYKLSYEIKSRISEADD